MAERGAKDVTDAVTRGVQDVSERARRPGNRGDDAAASEQGPNVEEVAADPAAYFSAEQQKANERLGHANILISGQTGVGKSTLIKAVFRVPLAQEGTGKPMTKTVQRYDVARVPVTIYDTPGIELGHAKKDVIRTTRRRLPTPEGAVRTRSSTLLGTASTQGRLGYRTTTWRSSARFPPRCR
jgi:50S ribosome-binding GTPase